MDPIGWMKTTSQIESMRTESGKCLHAEYPLLGKRIRSDSAIRNQVNFKDTKEQVKIMFFFPTKEKEASKR